MGDSVRAATTRIVASDTTPSLAPKLALAQIYATHVFPKARACHDGLIGLLFALQMCDEPIVRSTRYRSGSSF